MSGPITYDIEVVNPSNGTFATTLTMTGTQTDGSGVTKTAAVSVPAHSTQTVTVEDIPGYTRCGTRNYDLAFAPNATAIGRKAHTNGACTYTGVVTDPWASLTAAEKTQRQTGHSYFLNATASGKCGELYKYEVDLKNESSTAVTDFHFMWGPNGGTTLTVPAGQTKHASWTSISSFPFLGAGGQWWLKPQNQALPASMSERKYDLTYTQSCVLAIVTD